MKHFGDITKLSGYDLPIVDVITGGSPCQDLSVAGKRAGLAGERSGLFMEQMRIVKEMRERDRESGRTAWTVRPRYMVWENVPGAFSSGKPKGADFAAVIEEIIKVAEPGAVVDVCVPDRGWTKSGCYYAEDGSWSIAWRVHDAQFWGVPQRRKRIALVADFGGLSAPEILFERKGLRGDSEESGEAGQGAAYRTQESAGVAKPLSFDPSCNRYLGATFEDIAKSLTNGTSPGFHDAVLQRTNTENQQGTADGTEGGAGSTVAWTYRGREDGCNVETQDELAYSLRNPSGGGSQPNIMLRAVSFQERAGKPGGGISTTLPAAMAEGGGYVPMVANTLSCRYDGSPQPDKGNGANIVACDVYNQTIDGEIAPTVTAAAGGTNTSGPKVLCAGFKAGNGAQAQSIGYEEEKAPTLSAAPSGTNQVPAVFENHSQDSRYNPLGDICETVSAKYGTGGNNMPMVLEPIMLQNNQNNAMISQDGVSYTLPASAGMGGGYVPMVVEPLPFDTTQVTSDKNWSHPHYGDPCHPLAAGAHVPAVAIGNGQLNQMSMAEQANTLDTMHDHQAVLVFDKEMYNSGNGFTGEPQARADTVAPTVRSDSHPSGVCTSVVRRLTPLECERLQGYPDGWTDIGEWTDSKGKKHKDADSPRYKALGNSIALPFWAWLARRICAQYERTVTMASLFDGIGGFPLVFSRCGAVPAWASEIEEFCVAVTKERFGEE